MATNLQIDNELIEEAVKLGHHKTKKAAVTQALVEPKLSDFCRRIASISCSIATYDFPQRTKKVRLRKS